MKLWGKPMLHHFWNLKRYNEEFRKSGLEITRSEDISQNIIKGWRMYKKWLPGIKRKSFFQNVAFRIFYVINVRLNLYFLTTRQQYQVFKGKKNQA